MKVGFLKNQFWFLKIAMPSYNDGNQVLIIANVFELSGYLY